jgi:NitT/TauT family transport system ATP-binding protein
MEPLVVLNNVSMAYGKGASAVPAIEDVSLDIAPGEFIAVVGPSGCGKSSLMKLISGLHPVSQGDLKVKGETVTRPLKSVGMAFQNSNLLPWRTCVDNVLLPLEIVPPHRQRIGSHRAEGGRSTQFGGPDRLYREVSLAAFWRHAAACLDLPGPDS